jgi:hypothetical protein
MLEERLTFDLGTHTLELLEDGGVLLMDNTTRKEAIQLDADETYRLSIALISLLQVPMEPLRVSQTHYVKC